MPNVDLPLADKLLTPAEAGARYIDFVEQAVSVNRDFTKRVVGMLPTGVAAPRRRRPPRPPRRRRPPRPPSDARRLRAAPTNSTEPEPFPPRFGLVRVHSTFTTPRHAAAPSRIDLTMTESTSTGQRHLRRLHPQPAQVGRDVATRVGQTRRSVRRLPQPTRTRAPRAVGTGAPRFVRRTERPDRTPAAVPRAQRARPSERPTRSPPSPRSCSTRH